MKNDVDWAFRNFEMPNNVSNLRRRLVCKNRDENPLDFTHDLNRATFAS